MTHEDTRLRHLERQIWRLLAWRNISATNLEPWTAVGTRGEQRQVRLGDRWDDLGSPVRLELELAAPAPPGSLLEMFLEGDGIVFLDGGLAGAVNLFEREVPLDGARQIKIDVSPNDHFGLISSSARLVTARVSQPHRGVRELFRASLLAWETCSSQPNHEMTPHLLDAIEESLAALQFPSDADVVLERMRILREDLSLDLEAARSQNQHYGHMSPLSAITHLLNDTQPIDPVAASPPISVSNEHVGVQQALDRLSQRITELAQKFPPVGRLAATAHAHLDVAWLWPLSETRRKARHTFANVLTLMERFPEFHFTASSAQLYEYVREDDPELFERVRARVHEGRWEVIGGMWLEPDCNLPSGEAMARHLLYGQRYFQREFGRQSAVAWLPDTFGLTASLPQILALGGLRFFFTQKLNWNDTNKFPYDLWLWEGIDGTRLIAHSFENPIGGYNGQVTPESLEATWANFRGKVHHPESLFTFGMGDGGRGPTSDMLERLRLLDHYPVLPSARHTTVQEFFEQIDPANLPVWVGELYLEFHRGTYTTQSRLKRLNRMAEHRLQEAETAAALANLSGASYPTADLDQSWTTLLRNQFHDILPGSSIREVNEQAEQELGSVVERSIELRDRAVEQLGAGGSSAPERAVRLIRIFNPHGFERGLSCLLPRPTVRNQFRLLADDGKEIPWQYTADGGLLIHDPQTTISGTGYANLALVDGNVAEPPSGVTAVERVIENDLLRVTIGGDGSIASLIDKRVGREIFAGSGNRLRFFHDLPSDWEAWNLDDTSMLAGEALSDIDFIQVVETGPLRAGIEVRSRYGSSRVTQRYLLRADSTRLDIHTVIDWRERRKLLRAFFPLTVRSAKAVFETSFGAVERATHRNTSWDAARYEVPAQRWADLSEPGYGVSVLNDGRYGHSALGSILGVSLLRSPMVPDPLADLGRHEFTYSVYPHHGEWHEGGTVNQAIDLNSPLVGVALEPASSRIEQTSGSWFEIDGLTLAAIKRAEDSTDLVIRLYDPYGRHGVARITPRFSVKRAALANLLEEDIEQLTLEPDGSVRVRYGPFQILTLRLTPEAQRDH